MAVVDLSQTPAPFPQPQPQPQSVPASAAEAEARYREMLAIQAAAPVAINYEDMARYYFPYPSTRYTYSDKGCDEVQYGHDGKPYNPTGRTLYPYRCGGKTIELDLFGGVNGVGIAAAAAAALLLFGLMRRR